MDFGSRIGGFGAKIGAKFGGSGAKEVGSGVKIRGSVGKGEASGVKIVPIYVRPGMRALGPILEHLGSRLVALGPIV